MTVLALGDVRLRAFEPADLGLLLRARNDLELEALSQSTAPRPVGRGELAARLAAGHPAPSSGRDDDLEFAVTRASDPASGAIGFAGLYAVDRHNRTAELGAVIADPAARGAGLGLDCSVLLMRYAFRTLGLHKAYGYVKGSNAAALRTCHLIGLTPEGILPEHRWIDGRHVDLHVFGLLARDWDDGLLDWRSREALRPGAR